MDGRDAHAAAEDLLRGHGSEPTPAVVAAPRRWVIHNATAAVTYGIAVRDLLTRPKSEEYEGGARRVTASGSSDGRGGSASRSGETGRVPVPNEESGLGGAAATELRRLFEEFVGPSRAAAASPQRVEIASLVEPYLADLRARTTAGHAEKVAAQVRRVAAACPHGTTAEVMTFRLKRLATPVLWRRGRRGKDGKPPTRKPSNRTVNAEIAALTACLAWSVDAGLITASPLGTLKPLPQREGDLRKRRRALTDVEIARFLSAAEAMDRDHEYAQAPMWRTILACGLRWSECARLRAADVDKCVVTVRASTTKSRRTRRIPISKALAETLAALPRGDYLFRRPLGGYWADVHGKDALALFYATLERAKLDRIDDEGRSLDVHALRMTCASRMQRRKVPIAIVQRVLGHADVRLTARCYSEFGVDEIRRAVARAW